MPGSDGLIQDEKDAIEVSQKMGFPIMIKATAGGGGRGMRLAMTEKEFLPLLQQASQVKNSASLERSLPAIMRYRQCPPEAGCLLLSQQASAAAK